jgi:benzoyl-CoA reductase/2-hydroxyglutaryl-CoA dehydratase subunit BcrC/BadD/HgdB
MWKTLEDLLGTEFVTCPGIDMIFAGAVGAAVYAAKEARERASSESVAVTAVPGSLQTVVELVAAAEKRFIDEKAAKRVGFLCAYTPLELLAAAGVRWTRLMKAGDPAMVGAGELHTQSVLCDHTKSCIGGFVTGDPLFRAVDKVYSPHACGNMKRASEVIAEIVPTKLINVPKNCDEPSSRRFFRDELVHFKDDLEKLTGKSISDGDVQSQIVVFNQARKLLKRISELRKLPRPPLSGRGFLDLVRGFYLLPPERLLAEYQPLYDRLRASVASEAADRPIRLLVSGSIMADGDRRLLDIVESELGATVVVEDHCAGLRPVYQTLAETGDPFVALADGYLDQAPCSNRKPMSKAVDFTSELAREYDVDGVLYVYLKFCACYGLTKKDFIDRLQGRGLPVLDVSSDYSQSDHGQLKTRLEAFIEVLRERRGGRERRVGGRGRQSSAAQVAT